MRVRTWPALDVGTTTDHDLVLAEADDFAPTAVEHRGDTLRLFFSGTEARDRACLALRDAGYPTAPIDVDDDDWARRSQEGLRPVTVGRVTVSPPWHLDTPSTAPGDPAGVTVTVQPSMGFGTGHHATTRLCLRALQTLDLSRHFVLDVGTGSGVLALAAVRLGAAGALGVDYDADAIHSAAENLTWNPGIRDVVFEVGDLFSSSLPAADVVTANLTGAFLVRAAERLLDALHPGGTLIVSGLLLEERDEVLGAFGSLRVVWEQAEDGWLAFGMKRPEEISPKSSRSGLIPREG